MTMPQKLVVYLMTILGALLIPCLPAAAADGSPADRIKEAAKNLMLAPADGNSLQTVLDYARSADADPQIKSLSMAVYALAALAQGDTNLFARAKDSHAANYPSDKRMIPFTLSACVSSCDACGGSGYSEKPFDCSSCGNTRRCRRCNGTGKWQTVSAFDSRAVNRPGSGNIKCNQCGGSGRCPICNGDSIQRTRCTVCSGSGSTLTLPHVKLSSTMKALLGDLLSKIESEENLAERIRTVKAETNLLVRIALLTSLQKDLQKRPEAPEIERLLLADQQSLVAYKVAERQKAEAQEREMRSLRALKDAPAPQAAIATLSEYLASHPDSPHRVEIQTLLEESKAKLAKQKTNKKIAYAVGAAVVLLLGISSLNISYIRYNIFSGNARPR